MGKKNLLPTIDKDGKNEYDCGTRGSAGPSLKPKSGDAGEGLHGLAKDATEVSDKGDSLGIETFEFSCIGAMVSLDISSLLSSSSILSLQIKIPSESFKKCT